jgi:hypothetical protein
LGISPSINIRHGADGVIGTAMKSCIHKHPTHLDQRSLKPPNPFHGGSSDNTGGRGKFGDRGKFGGRGQTWQPEIVLQKEQTSVINRVYGRWKNFSAVSLTPMNSLSLLSLTPLNNLSSVSTFYQVLATLLMRLRRLSKSSRGHVYSLLPSASTPLFQQI